MLYFRFLFCLYEANVVATGLCFPFALISTKNKGTTQHQIYIHFTRSPYM